MICCCECVFNLGCVDLCALLKTGQTAASDGNYTLVYRKPSGSKGRKVSAHLTGEEITFDLEGLNPNTWYQAGILSPDGEPLELTDETLTFDCLRFYTEMEPKFVT